jgi:hypothetical protein
MAKFTVNTTRFDTNKNFKFRVIWKANLDCYADGGANAELTIASFTP